jgi:hypothetical protein
LWTLVAFSFQQKIMTAVNTHGKICTKLNEQLFQENYMNITWKIFGGALALGLAGTALTAGDLPPIRTFGSVSYVTGGIGLDESDAIKAAEKDFSLSLLFAQTRRGEFVSDVKVNIKDKAGKTVLEALSDGPMLLARLPAGAYTVSADYDGKTLVRKVNVDAKGVARAGFVWQPAAKATIE